MAVLRNIELKLCVITAKKDFKNHAELVSQVIIQAFLDMHTAEDLCGNSQNQSLPTLTENSKTTANFIRLKFNHFKA